MATREDVIEAALPNIIANGDGAEWFFWPTEDRGGWTADDLRIIASELDALNKRYLAPANS